MIRELRRFDYIDYCIDTEKVGDVWRVIITSADHPGKTPEMREYTLSQPKGEKEACGQAWRKFIEEKEAERKEREQRRSPAE